MGYSYNHLSASPLFPQPLEEAREGSWTGLGLCCLHEVHARLWLWKYQPPPGNSLYTTGMAAEIGVEMRFELLGWEALMAFPDLQWDPKEAASWD